MTTPSGIMPLGDNWHNGVNNAGNKSFCAYRVGTGIPGYSGYMPGPETICIPYKRGVMTRAPIEDQHGDRARGDGGTIKQHDSTHKTDFSITPAEFMTATLPNALWDNKAPRPIGDPPFIRRPDEDAMRNRPFISSTTFRDTFKDAATKKGEHPQNVTHLGQLRPPDATPGRGAEVENVFMCSEHTQKMEQIHGAEKLPQPDVPTPPERANPDIAEVKLRHPALLTSYRNDFGVFGADPNTKMAADPTEMSMRASTAEYNMGTTRFSCHPPGYSGFIPETARNAKASMHGHCANPRESTKKFELSTLFQYPHDIPGYAGYRPRTTINDVGPNRAPWLTTTGRTTAKGASEFQPGDLGLSISILAQTAPQPSMHAKKSSIRQDLFSHESQTGCLSDNGKADSDLYYHKTRPMEGRSVAIIKQGHWNQAY